MKTLTLILAVVLTTLGTSCMTMKPNKFEQPVSYIYAIDSTSSAYESPEEPGTFHKNYDTVKIAVKNVWWTGGGKTSYKIVKN